MRTALALFAAGAAFCQSGGAITGSITDPDGRFVEHATVHVKNSGTGTELDVRGSGKGVYIFSNLPAGSYDLTVPELGFTFAKLERKNLVVTPGQTVRLDLRLASAHLRLHHCSAPSASEPAAMFYSLWRPRAL